MTTRRLLFATRNAGKLRELRALLAEARYRGDQLAVIGFDDLARPPAEVEETGATYAENAALKARAAAADAGLLALADDSGLDVDALDGRPGVRSARYLGLPEMARERVGLAASDADRCRWLLEELSGVPEARRTARFRCAIALVDPAALDAPVIREAACEGRILDAPRGSGGFGYDPLFYVEQLGCTFAEASAADKNRLSHRGQAMRAMARYLAEA
ncbi:MAG: RdgB/HAM1 family non-canonical purine NTP pyrophosphatase [Myxococcales bacterium]|nr:RdgB/HAM1 family non-canonical purine NTP pyrophosphatase [Myxococcales bacterium]